MVVLFAMFSLTLVVLAVFSRLETARVAMKILEKFIANVFKYLSP